MNSLRRGSSQPSVISYGSTASTALQRSTSTISNIGRNPLRESELLLFAKRAVTLILVAGASQIILAILAIVVVKSLVVSIAAFVIGAEYIVAGAYGLYTIKFGEKCPIKVASILSGLASLLSVIGIMTAVEGIKEASVYFYKCSLPHTLGCTQNRHRLNETGIILSVVIAIIYFLTLLTSLMHSCIWSEIGARVLKRIMKYSVYAMMNNSNHSIPRKPIRSRPKKAYDNPTMMYDDISPVHGSPMPIVNSKPSYDITDGSSTLMYHPRTSLPPQDLSTPPIPQKTKTKDTNHIGNNNQNSISKSMPKRATLARQESYFLKELEDESRY